MVTLDDLLGKLAANKDKESAKKEVLTAIEGIPLDELYTTIVQNHDKIKQTIADLASDIKNVQYQDQVQLYAQLQRTCCQKYQNEMHKINPADDSKEHNKLLAVTAESFVLDVIEGYGVRNKDWARVVKTSFLQEADERLHAAK